MRELRGCWFGDKRILVSCPESTWRCACRYNARMGKPLSETRITAASREVAAGGIALELVFETGSTNGDLLSRVGSLVQPTARVAEMQTAGRGRAGRRWHSSPGAALTFSLAWHFDGPVSQLVGLPLSVGVAIVETLRGFGVEALLKWPNDVLKDGAKLAGILVETAAERGPRAGCWAIIGIGINIDVTDELDQAISTRVADFGANARDVDRDLVLAALLDQLATAARAFEKTGLHTFVDRWNALHAWRGAGVVILDHGHALHTGRALGIDRQGRLLLETANGEVAIMAGDVSLRETAEG
jgi:BirA family biotin operon repressor/biotin-[acetyl-CoA-carboxylase] ligase